mmetsp:Transcript_38628/g.28498  ORF Transcript_38628/g.28498 Transcript_38628/m.28498 type:complete len:104 (-) Transcript_38628:711-1022(-)
MDAYQNDTVSENKSFFGGDSTTPNLEKRGKMELQDFIKPKMHLSRERNKFKSSYSNNNPYNQSDHSDLALKQDSGSNINLLNFMQKNEQVDSSFEQHRDKSIE